MTPREDWQPLFTVGELRKAIADLADDVPVLVEQYEGGLTSPSVEVSAVVLGAGDGGAGSMFGEHETAENAAWRRDMVDCPRVDALVFWRSPL